MDIHREGSLVKKDFTGEQTGSLVNFCETYEMRYGLSHLRNIRVTVKGKDKEADEKERKIQGKILKYTNEGYVRNISIEEDRTGFYFRVACSTAKFERIAAEIITLEYAWEKDVDSALIKIEKADSEDELFKALEDLEIGLPSKLPKQQINRVLKVFPKLLQSNATIRKKAAIIARQVRDPSVAQYLLQLMVDVEPKVRRAAVMDAESLRHFFTLDDIENVAKKLTKTLKYPDDEYARIYAAEALGFIGDVSAIDYLSDREHDTPDVQWAAIGAIATILPRLKDDGCSPNKIDLDHLIDFLSDVTADESKKGAIRETAVSALGHTIRAMIRYGSNLENPMEKSCRSLVNLITDYKASSLLRSTAAGVLQDVIKFWKERNPKSQLPTWLSLSALSEILSNLSSTLLNPWRGVYCPNINAPCEIEVETKNQCFIIFKYDAEKKERESWEHIIIEAVKNAGMTPLVSKDISTGEAKGSYGTLICQPIRGSRMCIADISRESINVGYEINLAWKYNRPVLITFQTGERADMNMVPFDLQGLHIVFYTDLDELKEKVPEKIRNILSTIEEKSLQ
jgi:HEAT repeat protein